jgi:hypothetical protein
MRDICKLHSDKSLDDYFYSPLLAKRIGELSDFLSSNHEINVYPEATIKPNGMPNGILIKSECKDSILLPSLLRDPGCGFVLFKIKDVPKPLLTKFCESLLEHCRDIERALPNEKNNIYLSLTNGIEWLEDAKPFFADSVFDVEQKHLYLDICLDELSKDLTSVTNSIELKVIKDEYQDSSMLTLYGFIHTGSDYLPRYISSKWLKHAARLSYATGLSDSEQIKKGCFGIQFRTDEAQEYRQLISAAMNYCLYKRWWLFSQLNKFAQNKFDFDIELVSDRCHAGLFFQQENAKLFVLQARGVQRLTQQNKHLETLLAGQKESISYLLKVSQPSYLGHGTSYSKRNSLSSLTLPEELRSQFPPIIANTTLDTANSVSFNFNIYQQKKYINHMLSSSFMLIPLMNYQGKYLRGTGL